MNSHSGNLDPFIRHGYAQVNGVRLHYAERGSGGRLILLLHGFPECWYSWRHQLSALGDRYHVVAPDLRGYNLSDKPGGVQDYQLAELVADVIGLIHHFSAREAAIVGHDWGAGVAWAVARKYPEHVWKLASLQVPPPAAWIGNMTWRQALRSWYMLFFKLPRIPEWWISAGDFAGLEQMFKATARRGTFTETDIAMYKAALREPGALTSALNYYRANISTATLLDVRCEWKRRGRGGGDDERIRVPTLFIYGERDFAVMPETVRGVGNYIDAPYREVRLAASGHWVQQESPDEVNAALHTFLRDEG